MSPDQLADLLAEISGVPRPALIKPSGDIGIKQATQLLGVSARTLRFYEEDGLLTAGRTVGAHRYYDARQMTRAFIIVVLRRLGLSVDAIRPLVTADPIADDLIGAALRGHVVALEGELNETRARLETTTRLLGRVNGGNVTSLAKHRQAGA